MVSSMTLKLNLASRPLSKGKSYLFIAFLSSMELVQWNESSKATSGGASHSLKIDFFEIPAMVGNFFSFRGLPTTKFFFLASKVGDENPLKWP